jgi:hypothetical protein
MLKEAPSPLSRVLSALNLNGNFRELLPDLTVGEVLDATATLKKWGIFI